MNQIASLSHEHKKDVSVVQEMRSDGSNDYCLFGVGKKNVELKKTIGDDFNSLNQANFMIYG